MIQSLRLLALPAAAAVIGLAAGNASAHLAANLSSAASTAAVIQESGTRIGVIDPDRLFNESEIGQALTERIRAFQTSTEDRMRTIQGEIRQLDEAYQSVSPTSDQARELRRQRQVRISAFQTEQQVFNAELQVLLRQSNIQLLLATEQAVRTVATDRGFDLVLRKSPPIPGDFDVTAQNAGEQLERLITRQVTLYVNPSIDITSLVLTQMNADFRAGGGRVPELQAPTTEPQQDGAGSPLDPANLAPTTPPTPPANSGSAGDDAPAGQ